MCIIGPYDETNKRYEVSIDKRVFEEFEFGVSLIKALDLFDLWNGPVTYKRSDLYYHFFHIYTTEKFNFDESEFFPVYIRYMAF